VSQTLWAELLVATLADAGVATCVVSPGSRSTPIVAALAREPRLEIITIIDERAAAFFALGAARATGAPVALACTSGSAAAHYLPALVEASLAGVPLIAITADRPPELHDCGASQTMPQVGMYGAFVRGAFDLGAPVASEAALRALRRKVLQAVTLARGPAPGPVHLEVPLRKPLEPAAPATDAERACARFVVELRSATRDAIVAPPRLAPDPTALAQLAAAIAAEPRGLIVAGALPPTFAARDAVLALAQRAGYPIVAEASSQLRFGPRPDDVTFVDRFDLIPELPAPGLVVQLGAAPVAAAWPAFVRTIGQRFVLAGASWHDPESSARAVIVGDIELALCALAEQPVAIGRGEWASRWRDADEQAAAALDEALAELPESETAKLRAVIDGLPAGTTLQIGNSLPIRTIDHLPGGGPARTVISQRGAAGIDGLIASAAGATLAGAPVTLVLGDVSFVHDLGGLVAARAARAPLAIVVIDNGGGQIFAGLPVANAGLGEAFERHWLTPTGVDPVAVAAALGVRNLVHLPVSATGARDVRQLARARHGQTTALLRRKS
jgi:2-succinyl-5-enolpyruvyl-6-hydroxy-3-cyclohexene-1-carboxylate synthase